MRPFISIVALIAFVCVCSAQSPIALSTSDPKFKARIEVIPRPTQALAFGTRWPNYSAGTRKAGQYEVAYCLVDEQGSLSPRSPSVVINPTVTEWDVVVSTPGLDLWTRATGTLWVFRPAGGAWQVLGGNRNAQTPDQCTRPYVPLCGWDHSLGGYMLFPAQGRWPGLSDPYWKVSTTLAVPPMPAVRLLCCPNVALEIAYSWCCQEGETPLSDITSIAVQPGEPADKHCPFQVYRNIIPPQGALGAYVYLRRPGQQWHRQRSHYADASFLWPIDSNQLPNNEFVETGIAPSATQGKSYLSSIHLAMRDWNRDIIVDTDQEITCPVISAYDGPSWVYDPRNQQTAIGTNAFSYPNEGWKIIVDGVSSGYLRPTINHDSWQAVADAAFGVGNVQVQYGSGFGGAIIVYAGKYAATDMTGRVTFDFSKMYQINTNDGSQPLKDGAGNPIPFPFVTVPSYEQAARSWYMSHGGQKFNRTIATSNGGKWNLSDKKGSGSWPLWVENSQRTNLTGCNLIRNGASAGVAFLDHSGGGAFAFRMKDCSATFGATVATYGVRCAWTSRGPAWNNHSASEPYFENCNFQGKFPVVVEGGQSVNWVFRDTYLIGDATVESALITQANSGALTFEGRTNVDNARTIGAMTWASKLDIAGIWLDQGVPCWFTITGNTFPSISINKNKINHWRDWLHVMESPAGSIGYPVTLTLSNLDSQFNGHPVAMLASARDMLTITQKDPVALLTNIVKTGMPDVVAQQRPLLRRR